LERLLALVVRLVRAVLGLWSAIVVLF